MYLYCTAPVLPMYCRWRQGDCQAPGSPEPHPQGQQGRGRLAQVGGVGCLAGRPEGVAQPAARHSFVLPACIAAQLTHRQLTAVCIVLPCVLPSACLPARPPARPPACLPARLPTCCSFVAYLSDIVVDGFAKAIVASLNQLHSQVGAAHNRCGAWLPLLLLLLLLQLLWCRLKTHRVALFVALADTTPPCCCCCYPRPALHLCRSTWRQYPGTTWCPCWRCSLSCLGPMWCGCPRWERQRAAAAAAAAAACAAWLTPGSGASWRQAPS